MPTQLHRSPIDNFRNTKDIDIASPEYIKGFQEGYMMTMHLPEIADWIAKIKSTEVRYIAFREGRLQYMVEQVNKLIAMFEDFGWDDEE